MAIKISRGVEIPRARGNTPDYPEIMEALKSLKDGDMAFLPIEDLPIEDARSVAGKFGRDLAAEASVIQRAQKNEKGEIIGLNVYRGPLTGKAMEKAAAIAAKKQAKEKPKKK